MAFDAFIKIDGIDGESTDDKHANWIEIVSFNNGLTQSVSSTASSSGGASAERANFQDFNFTKQLDIASPALALACADGTHIDEITVKLQSLTTSIPVLTFVRQGARHAGRKTKGKGHEGLHVATIFVLFCNIGRFKGTT